MITTALWVAVALIAIALIFDFTNGFHDAANAVATVVATKSLTPVQAVVMAAFFNFVIMFFITFKVAATIGKGIVDPSAITLTVVFGCLAAAIAWNLITWWLGLPTSSSHALIGGLVGAAVTAAGWNTVVYEGFRNILISIVAAPVIGFVLGTAINRGIRTFLPHGSENQNKWYHRLQIASSALYSMGHGSNDAQKTAGIIFLILVASNMVPKSDPIPMWGIWLSFTAMGLGTLVGGWRIVDTMARKLTSLNPRQGFAANTGGSMMLFVASYLGIPVSTTHTIAGAIMGVGSSEPGSAVQWGKAGEIVTAWVLTIPCTAALGSIFYLGAQALLEAS